MFKFEDSILGISFDGLAVSGIVNELLSVSALLRSRKFRVLIDLGYDIRFFKNLDSDGSFFPGWVDLIRCLGSNPPKGYSAEIVKEARSRVIAGTTVTTAKVYDDICHRVAELIVATLLREKVRILIVENGTLPDNPIFTEAIYLAISEYGTRANLGKYVLWRDHDLMWSAEPHLFGSYPYPGVHKPQATRHIHYAVITDWMRTRMQAWAPSATYSVIPNRFFSLNLQQPRHRALRNAYGIPKDAFLIARCTRVVPQKSIERDLRLLHQLQLRFGAMGNRRKVFLFVTGPTSEDAAEFARLRALEKTLSIAGQVVWGDGLLPLNPVILDPASQSGRFSVRDLLAEADLSSFLTTFDYEGFGNPPGEAMAMGVPFISTTYELYHEVYGSKGAIAPLLPIDRFTAADGPMPNTFIDWTLRALTDEEYRAQIVKRNLDVCQRFFSQDALEQQLEQMFSDIFS